MQDVVINHRHESGLTINLRGSIKRRLKADVLVHTLAAQLTIVFTEAALGLDGLGYIIGLSRLMEVGCWALAGAVGLATVTALAGVAMRRRYRGRLKESRAFLRTHQWLGIIFYASLVALLVWRMGIRASADPAVGWLYLLALLGASLILILQVYLGGEVTYHFAAEREPIPLIPKKAKATSTSAARLAGEL